MFKEATFTRAEVANLSGAPDDVVAHWIKEGLINPIEGGKGRGRHRIFPAREVNKAAIISQLRRLRCSIQMLRYVVGLIDRAYELTDKYPALDPDFFYVPALHAPVYREFVEGGPALIWTTDDGETIRRRAKSLEDITQLDERTFGPSAMQAIHALIEAHYSNDDDLMAMKIASDLSARSLESRLSRVVWMIWPVHELSWGFYTDSDENLSGIREWPEAALLLHVSRILKPMWGFEYVSSWDS